MSILGLLASQRNGQEPPGPDPTPTVPPSSLLELAPVALDWSAQEHIVSVLSSPGATQLREQDDIIYDPGAADPARRWCFYYSANYGNGPVSKVWVAHSRDGVEWTDPKPCIDVTREKVLGGEDPSITQTLTTNPVAYRDAAGRLVMFCEDGGLNDIYAYASTDGVNWSLEKESAIEVAPGGSGWDHVLVGSPNARHDGTKFVIGYEGIQYSPTRIETFSVAWGPTPSTLTKTPNNPVIDPTQVPGLSNSIVSDGFYISPDGTKIILFAHTGIFASGKTMWRMVTSNLDPTTWQQGDFTLLGMVDPTHWGDFTLDLYRGLAVTKSATPEHPSYNAPSPYMVRLPLVPA